MRVRKNHIFLHIFSHGLILMMLGMSCALPGWSQTTSDTNLSSVVGAGARAWGMGGAFIAVADDATAASWNPGGLGQLEKPEISLVFRYQQFNNTTPAGSNLQDNLRFYQYKGPLDLNSTAYNIDFASITFPFKIGGIKIVPQLSYQRAISFKLESSSNQSPFSWVPQPVGGRVYGADGEMSKSERVSGGPDMISISVGTRFFKRLNLGVSLNFWGNGYNGRYANHFKGLIYAMDAPTETTPFLLSDYQTSDIKIKCTTYNLGFLLDVTDKFKIGAVYKSGTDSDVDYELILSIGGLGPIPGIERTFRGSTTMYWPGTWGVGMSYRFIDPFTVSIDFTKTNWSQCILRNIPYQGIYQDIYFPTLQPVEQVENPVIPHLPVSELEQKDTRQVRIGMEYILFGKDVLFPLRCGFFTDTQYFADSSGNSVTYHGVTGGLGIKWGGLSTDLAVIYEWGSYLRDNYHFYKTQFSELRAYVSMVYSF